MTRKLEIHAGAGGRDGPDPLHRSLEHIGETTMPYRRNYPATVAEVLVDGKKFSPDALRAVKELARAKPWKQEPPRRLELFRICAVKLAGAYGVRCPRVEQGAIDCYIPAFDLIQLTEKLSVVTFLHEFAHARGFDERQACRWSLNIFRRCFPRSFAACEQVGHTLVNNR